MSIFTMIRILLLPTQEEKDLADSLRKLKTLKVSNRGAISINPSEVWTYNKSNKEKHR